MYFSNFYLTNLCKSCICSKINHPYTVFFILFFSFPLMGHCTPQRDNHNNYIITKLKINKNNNSNEML